MSDFRTIQKSCDSYSLYITSEDKDAVIDLMLNRKGEEEIVRLDYKDVSCSLNISKGQYLSLIHI